MPITRQHKKYERVYWAGKPSTMSWEDNVRIVNEEGDKLHNHICRVIIKREKIRRLKRAAKKSVRQKQKIALYAAIAGINGPAKRKRAERFQRRQQNRKRRNERKQFTKRRIVES